MFSRPLLWRSISALLIILIPVTATGVEPFDFRGAMLGVSLIEFRKLEFPGGERHNKPELFGKPVLACTGDARLKKIEISLHHEDETLLFRVEDADRKLSIKRCAWYEWYVPVKELPGRWLSAKVSVAGQLTRDVSYSFIKTPQDSDHRLYQIDIYLTSQAFPSVKAGLIERFGKPERTDTKMVRNMFGSTVPSTETLWFNKVSSISVVERFQKIDEMYLQYFHVNLGNYVRNERKKITGTPGSSL